MQLFVCLAIGICLAPHLLQIPFTANNVISSDSLEVILGDIHFV